MFCFKKISESLLYKKALEGCFRGFNSKREIVCVNDTSIHLYEVNPQGITLITKFDLNCTVLDCALFFNSETVNGQNLTSLLVTTISDSLIMLEFNKSADRFEIVGQFCFAHLNKSLPSICQFGRHLSVLGSKKQMIVMTAYMQNMVVLEYQGVFIQKQSIQIKGQILHKIIPFENNKEQYFQVLTSELTQREQLKIRVIKVEISSQNSDQGNQQVLAHVPNLKNLNKQIEVPLDFVTYDDSDGNFNYLVLTSLQAINIKIDKKSNKQSHAILLILFKEGSQKVQPLSLKEFQSNIAVVFNDGGCCQLIKNTTPNIYGGFSFGVDRNYIDTFSPNDKFNFWVTISDQSIQVGKQKDSSFQALTSIPLFSSILSSAVDPQTGNIYSIINGNKSHLRLITDAFSAQDLRIHCRSIFKDAKVVFWRQDYYNSSSQNACQFAIVSSLTKSFVIRNQSNSDSKAPLKMKLQPINEVYSFIKEQEVVIGASYFDNKILLVLPTRMVVIDDQSQLLISEFNMKNDKEQIVKCSILQNQYVFALTKSNKILAFQKDFIHLKQLDTSKLSLEDSQISALSTYSSQNSNYLCVGYYNASISTVTWSVSDDNTELAVESQSNKKLPEIVHDIHFYSNQQTQGVILSLRNGVICDIIQIDYSKSKSEQKDQVVMLTLQNRDQCKIFKINGNIYLQSSHAIYQYFQSETKRQASQIVLSEYPIWKDTNRIKCFFPLSLDSVVIIASENIYTASFPSGKSKNLQETKQVSIPLSVQSETAPKSTETALFASQATFKRIIYYSPLDLFVIVDLEGRLYLVNRVGFILQIFTDIYQLNQIITSMKVIKINRKFVLAVTSKTKGVVLFTIQPASIGGGIVSKEEARLRGIFQLDIIQIMSLFDHQEENTTEAIDVSFMPLFGILLVSGAQTITCFSLAETFDSAKEDKVLSFNQIYVHKHETGNRIVCIDSCKNLVLVGDAKESILVYNISYKQEAKKHFLSWHLEKTEFNQRALKESLFLGDSKVLGIDKYGELFCSILDQRAFYDANYNLHNFSQLNLRETGQILELKGSNDAFNVNKASTNALIICGIGGSVFQVQFCDLLFAFETESYNSYIFLIEEKLRQIKSCRVSQKKCSIDIQRATQKLGNSQRLVDVSLFEQLVESDYQQILTDLKQSIKNKEEAGKLKLSEIKALIQMLIEPFEHRSSNKKSIFQS